jgi:hypothetical protein
VISLIQPALIILLLVISVAAQDPLKVAPEAYKLEFENDWVRVVRVHYGPHTRIPVHDHPSWATAYVYLNDAPEVMFKHQGSSHLGTITRPATKAGAFRLYRAVKEVHEVENSGDTPSDFLRVEFKTKPAGESTLRGRFYREDSGNENYQKVQFENEQIRITRIICAGGQTLKLASGSARPSLFVALTAGSLSVSDLKGSSIKLEIQPGQTTWFGGQQPQSLTNVVASNAEFLRFDFKTAPGRVPRK